MPVAAGNSSSPSWYVSPRDTSKYPKDCYFIFNSLISSVILINPWILLQKWISDVNLCRVTHWEYPWIITPYGTLAILKVPRRNYYKTLKCKIFNMLIHSISIFLAQRKNINKVVKQYKPCLPWLRIYFYGKYTTY